MKVVIDTKAVLDVTTQYVLPAVGGLMGFLLAASPLKALQTVQRRGKLGTMNPLPACVLLCNCCVWLMYGVAIKDPFLFVANMPSVPVNLHIILRSYIYASKTLRFQMERILLGSLVLVLSLGVIYVFDKEKGSAVHANGTSAMIVNILMYATPLSTMGLAIKSRNSSSIYLPWTFTALGCSSAWLVYGLMIKEMPVIVPNVFGFLLCLLQLLLRMVLLKHPHRPTFSRRPSNSSSSGSSSNSRYIRAASLPTQKKRGMKGRILEKHTCISNQLPPPAPSTGAAATLGSALSSVVVMDGAASSGGGIGGSQEIEMTGLSASAVTLSMSSSSLYSLGKRVNSLTPLCEENSYHGEEAGQGYDMTRMEDGEGHDGYDETDDEDDVGLDMSDDDEEEDEDYSYRRRQHHHHHHHHNYQQQQHHHHRQQQQQQEEVFVRGGEEEGKVEKQQKSQQYLAGSKEEKGEGEEGGSRTREQQLRRREEEGTSSLLLKNVSSAMLLCSLEENEVIDLS